MWTEVEETKHERQMFKLHSVLQNTFFYLNKNILEYLQKILWFLTNKLQRNVKWN